MHKRSPTSEWMGMFFRLFFRPLHFLGDAAQNFAPLNRKLQCDWIAIDILLKYILKYGNRLQDTYKPTLTCLSSDLLGQVNINKAVLYINSLIYRPLYELHLLKDLGFRFRRGPHQGSRLHNIILVWLQGHRVRVIYYSPVTLVVFSFYMYIAASFGRYWTAKQITSNETTSSFLTYFSGAYT